MKKIKVVGMMVFLLAFFLALLSTHISKENEYHLNDLRCLNEQKSLTQEISKSIFYYYRNHQDISEKLDKTIAIFVSKNNINLLNEPQTLKRWNQFYADVNQFRKVTKVKTGYNSIITEKLVNRIYHNNVMLVNELNFVIESKESSLTQHIKRYKELQYFLFLILIVLLMYLFTQIRVIIKFIYKFSQASNKIIKNSTIEGIEPIILEKSDKDLKEVSQNYNHLIKKINDSIFYSIQSMEQSGQSLEEVAKNIEDFMELLSLMYNEDTNLLFKKEDVVIESLETIMTLRQKLKDLEKDLNRLIDTSIKKSHNLT
jgi:methyl-accepting chemotaxis protein